MEQSRHFLMRSISLLCIAKSKISAVLFLLHLFLFCINLHAQKDSLRSPRFGSFNINLGFLGYEKLKPKSDVGYMIFTPYYSPKIDIGYEYIIDRFKLGIELNAGLNQSGFRMGYSKRMLKIRDLVSDSERKSINTFFDRYPVWARYYLLTHDDLTPYLKATINKYFLLQNNRILRLSLGIARSFYYMNDSEFGVTVISDSKSRAYAWKGTVYSKADRKTPYGYYETFNSLQLKVGIGKLVWHRLLTLDIEYNQGLEEVYKGTITEDEKFINKYYTSTWSWTNTYLAINLQYGLGKWRKPKNKLVIQP
jgi:hypothetical protein